MASREKRIFFGKAINAPQSFFRFKVRIAAVFAKARILAPWVDHLGSTFFAHFPKSLTAVETKIGFIESF